MTFKGIITSVSATCWKATPTEQPAPVQQPAQQGWEAAYPPPSQPAPPQQAEQAGDLPF